MIDQTTKLPAAINGQWIVTNVNTTNNTFQLQGSSATGTESFIGGHRHLVYQRGHDPILAQLQRTEHRDHRDQQSQRQGDHDYYREHGRTDPRRADYD